MGLSVRGQNFSPHLLAGKFNRTVPGQGWRCYSIRRYFIGCIADLLYSPAGMGGTPQSNGAPRVQDPDAVPMAMTSALICPRTLGPDCWPAAPCTPLLDVPLQGFLRTQATGVDKKRTPDSRERPTCPAGGRDST